MTRGGLLRHLAARRSVSLSRSLIFALVVTSGCAVPPTASQLTSRLPQAYVPISELSVAILAGQGVTAFRSNRLAEAELRFVQALEKAQGAAEISEEDIIGLELNLALVLIARGNPEGGAERLQSLLQRFPDSARLHVALGNALLEANRGDAALERYDAAIDILKSAEKVDWDTIATVARTAAGAAYRFGAEQKAWCYSDLAFQLANNRADLLAHGALLLAIGRSEEVRPAVEKLFPAPAFGPDPAIIALVAQAEAAQGNSAEFHTLAKNAAKSGLLSLEDRAILTKLHVWIPEPPAAQATSGEPTDSQEEPESPGTDAAAEDPFTDSEIYLEAPLASGSPSAFFDLMKVRYMERAAAE